jgi:hypothetical protein
LSRPPLSARYVGERRWRPPKVELHFDVTVRNDGSEPRWAILPDTLSRPLGGGEPAPVYSIDVYELAGTGRAVVAHFLGDQGFYALFMPASAEVALHGFPIPYWGELPDSVELELTMAEALLVDGAPAEARFRIDLRSEPGAQVDAGPLANQASVVEAIGPESGGALAAEWREGRETRQRVELGQTAAPSSG